MSAVAPVRRPAALRSPSPRRTVEAAPRRTGETTRPRLVLVSPHPTTAGRLPFLIVVGAVMVGGLVAVLLLHMVAAQDAFRVTSLQQRLAGLTAQIQQQQQVVADDSSPGALQARATALGMVPTTMTTVHRRPDGRALAVQSPVYIAPPAPPKPKTHKTAKTAKTTTTKAAAKPPATAGTTSKKHHKSGHQSQ
jgi:hypothetical protein